MSSGVFFQIRPTRRSNPESRTTLDALHNHQLESFSKEKDTIEDLKARKELIQNQINASSDDIKIARYEVEMRDIDKKINHLSQNKEVFDYFLSTGDLLFQYTHWTKLSRVQILNVKASDLQSTLDTGYWEGKPSVTQVFPDSDIGYFNISGTIVETV